ncbi:uncharacterized protein B0H18DRAFT_992063 [Fomitopsis serialis]|uniref:uncharacterized protein n=1 Tax=Fomitopsis serialis TaxID=139415 RepID=UPI0020078252|nr:uncharacterized protein B0H18DRAFT_992063 [Neoantrodia serialis]KAH9930964.1 hypothetical protein B0H18DRAFT_992063 [Neoantrodia serialis]
MANWQLTRTTIAVKDTYLRSLIRRPFTSSERKACVEPTHQHTTDSSGLHWQVSCHGGTQHTEGVDGFTSAL